MSRLFLIFLCLIFHQQAYCQNWCGANDKKILSFSPDITALKSQKKASGSWVKRIPVVFHILHDNGPENIPDSLIYQQIDILNEDFRKKPGTPGFGAGVDTEIEFCLATIDTAGNPTTGITRTQTPCTDYRFPSCDILPMTIIHWNTTERKYLNIWLYKAGSVLAWGGLNGIGADYGVIGRNGLNSGKILTHEAGHFLSLAHTFKNGCGAGDCATSGDMVCDTPPEAAPNWGCYTGINSCTNDVPDLPDQFENYMDYSSSCANMFTNGQKERMHSRLSSGFYDSLVSYSNLQKTGCEPCILLPCAPISDFRADKKVVSVNEKVSFTDISYFGATSRKWLFPGGNPSSDTLQYPSVTYDSAGTYSVTLIVTNAGGSDTATKPGFISVMGTQWSGLGKGATAAVVSRSLLTVYNSELFVGADNGYVTSGNDTINYIARWNGADWYPLDTTVVNNQVSALYVYKNELYVGIYKKGIAKWNGNSWSWVLSETQNWIWDMVEYKNELYFASTDNLYKWDGSLVSLVATYSFNGDASVLEVYNNELYVFGDEGFDSINNIAVKQIARYNGSNWSSVGSSGFSIYGGASSTAVYDSMLYIGGFFDSVNGVAATNIARWDGSNWYPVGQGLFLSGFPSGFAFVESMTVLDNKLYVGGYFNLGNGVKNITSWDKTSWSPVGSGTNGIVYGLTSSNDALYATGKFTVAGGDTVNYIAKWGCSLYAKITQSADTIDLAASGSVSFTDNSKNSTQWIWNFGDGETSAMQNPSHTYSQKGTYTVSLTISNGTCISKDTSVVVVKWDCYPLSIDFQQSTDTIDIALAPDTVNFTSQTFFTDSLLWNFGDGAKDTAQNPMHIYPAIKGIYNVSLTGYMDTCSNFASSKVIICSKPKAIFSKNKDTVDLAVSGAVQFTNSSSNASIWSWNFGDASNDTAKNPTHIYSNTGTYTVTLSASDSVCVAIATATVVVVNSTGVKVSPLGGTEGGLGGLKIFPNPNTGQFTLEMILQKNASLSIKFFHITGQLIFSEDISNASGIYSRKIDMSKYAKGIYYVQVITDDGVIIRKVVYQ